MLFKSQFLGEKIMKNNLLVLSIACLCLSGCISAEERAAARYRMNTILDQQCAVAMGFRQGTNQYMECRMFYDDVLTSREIKLNYMSLSTVNNFKMDLDDLNRTCMQYLGNMNPPAGAIWGCVKKKEQAQIDERLRKQRLKEQEESQRRAISGALKEANEDSKLQDRILAERNRVAAEKNKRPSDVTCRTYDKGNGYTQVKCK